MSLVLGIDLGTTNSVVAVADGGTSRVLADVEGRRLIPSVVSFHPDGQILVGESARERRLIDATNTIYSVKRLIGRPFRSSEVRRAQERLPFSLVESPNGGVVVQVRTETYTLTEISAYVLREVRKVAEAALDTACQRAVITVPANFNELQRSATKAAGRVAGLQVLRIINEPTAAALAYGWDQDKPQRLAIYDLGGGTFDITILELEGDVFEVVATAGDTFLGGDDLDLLIAETMADRFLEQHRWDPREDRQAFERLRAAAEWAKCKLSEDSDVELTVEELTYGPGGKALDFEFQMARSELEPKMLPLLGRSFDVVNEALREAGMRPADIDSVVLVGGSTRIPLVRNMVTEFFGQEPETKIDPDLVVAQGAAIHGFALGGKPAKKSLGRVALKKVTPEELAAARQQRAEATQGRPRQPAFAPVVDKPAEQVLAPPPRRRPPSDMPDLPAPVNRPSVKVSPVVDVLDEIPTGIHRSQPPPPKPGAATLPELSAPFAEARGVTFPLAEDEPTSVRNLDEIAAQHFDSRETQEQEALASVPLPGPPPVPAAYTPPPPPPPRPPPPPPERGIGPAATLAAGGIDFDSSTASLDIAAGLDISRPDIDPSQPLDLGAAEATSATELELGVVQPPVPAAPPPPSSRPAPQPVIQMSQRKAPLLMDVTPHSLGIETVGGYCQHLIRRNAPIPSEQTRTFSTAHDGQEVVHARVCQGESRLFEENQVLGEVMLTGLRRAARGEVQIEVSFILDANGTLDVKATDIATGVEQSIRINLLGGLGEEEVRRMAARQHAAFG